MASLRRCAPLVLLLTLIAGCGEDVAPQRLPDLATVEPAPDLAVVVVDDLAQPPGPEDLAVVVPETPDDLAVPPSPCANTGASCGLATCVSCTGSPAGSACVQSACGCNTFADCPNGTACDPATHLCGVGCAGGLTCKGGCCDGTSCVTGGYVPACGVSGGSCDDCTVSPGGPLCVGHCGCLTSADCPSGQACKDNTCGSACDDSHLCNGACCNGGTCSDTCEASNDGHTCLNPSTDLGGQPFCGCNTRTDCPQNMACNKNTHQCSTSCNGPGDSLCNGGCCSGANTCVGPGQQSGTVCGDTGGDCGSCVGYAFGIACQATATGGFCGCSVAGTSECTNGNSCDTNSKQCIITCAQDGGTGLCTPTGGCCGGNSVCAAGNGNAACGLAGAACVDCTAQSVGHKCLPNKTCGCTGPADCPSGKACNDSGQCVTACDSNHPCNGCCSAASQGTCSAGTATAICGNGSTQVLCQDCAVSALGKVCNAVNLGGRCGCNTLATECPTGRSCYVGKKSCSTTCGLSGSTRGFTGCNGGCCGVGAGTRLCQKGASRTNCGLTGDGCAVCANGTPSCVAGACTSACNTTGGSIGTCGGGYCCSGTTCVSGTADTACGASGTCKNCQVDVDAGIPRGVKCITNPDAGVSACGCTGGADCPLHESCQTSKTPTAACSPSCSGAGFTSCNTGCCYNAIQACVGGRAELQCGSNGGACVSCACSTQGPNCVVVAEGGTCGCKYGSDCAAQATSCDSISDSRTVCQGGPYLCCIPTGGDCTGGGSCCPPLACTSGTCQ